MANKADEILKTMPPLLKKLENSELLSQPLPTKNSEIPVAGIYVFYENGKPKYVGRSNKHRLQQRIREHSHPKGRSSSATWAYKLAKKRVAKDDPSFADVFAMQRERIGQMQVKVVGIIDPKQQYFLEAYVAAALGIPFQWETH